MALCFLKVWRARCLTRPVVTRAPRPATQATKFYDEYANKCVANGHIVDIYSCALDQCTGPAPPGAVKRP
jgi:hypothetical protein